MPRKLVRKLQNSEPEPEASNNEPEDEQPEVMEWKPTPLLYDVTDACFILGKISKQMLYRLIHIHQIRPVKIGTRSLFTMEELDRFVQERVQESLAG